MAALSCSHSLFRNSIPAVDPLNPAASVRACQYNQERLFRRLKVLAVGGGVGDKAGINHLSPPNQGGDHPGVQAGVRSELTGISHCFG